MTRDRSASRRRFLRAVGTALAAPVLPSLFYDREAHAGGAPRLVIFYTPLGPCEETWRMRRPGLPTENVDWEFPLDGVPENEWSQVLRPLFPQRKNIIVLDGLAYTSAFADPIGGNAQALANAHLLTGALMLRPVPDLGDGSAPSVDQIVANSLSSPGPNRSIVFARPGTQGPSFVGPGKATPVEPSPLVTFDRLFGGNLVPQTKAVQDANGRVLDLLQRDYTALSKRVGGADRRKVEQHRDMIAELARRVAASTSSVCAPPPRSSVPSRYAYNGDTLGALDLSIDVASAALACERTRVAVIQADYLRATDFGANPLVSVHEDIYDATGVSAANVLLMGEFYRVYAQQFAYLLERLDQHNLLDSTAVLWLCEQGPRHQLNRLMFVLAGRASGGFRTGRYIRYQETGPNPGTTVSGSAEPLGPGHNHLLVSLMQAMGLSNNSIGMTSAVGATVGKGQPIDLTGPLPRLK